MALEHASVEASPSVRPSFLGTALLALHRACSPILRCWRLGSFTPSEGGGRAVAFVDDRLSEAQREALAELVGGRAGGPWGIFINTYELEGPRTVRHEIDIAGAHTRVCVGSVAELSTEPIRNPVSGAEVSSTVLLPSGLVTHEAAMLASSIFRIDASVSYDHSGKYAAVGDFSYRGP